MRVFVYRNLHKDCYSVRALQGPSKGRVIARVKWVVIQNPEFVVSEKGRQRVLHRKQKNVHAGIRGKWLGTAPYPFHSLTGAARITYNPYRFISFTKCGTLIPVYAARLASCEPTGVWILDD